MLQLQAAGVELLPAEDPSTLLASKLGESRWQAALARHAAFPVGCCYLLLAVASSVTFSIAACRTSLLPILANVQDAIFEDVKTHTQHLYMKAHLIWWLALAMFVTAPGWLVWSAVIMLCSNTSRGWSASQTSKTTTLTGRISRCIADHKDFLTALHGHWFLLDMLVPWIWLATAYVCLFVVALPVYDKLPQGFVVTGWLCIASLTGMAVAVWLRKGLRMNDAYEHSRQLRQDAWQRVLTARASVHNLDSPGGVV